MKIENRLDFDVRSYCNQIRKWVKKKYGRIRTKKINVYPAMVSSCCFNRTKIFHDRSCASTNVEFDRRINSRFKLLGGKVGQVVPGCDNHLGYCAEQRAANELLRNTRSQTRNYKIEEIIFSNAYRPRTMQVKRMCSNCKFIFGK